MIKSLHLAIVIVILTGWYNENIGIGLKILITILAVFIFIALFINDFLKNKKAKEETISRFSSAIDEILNSLHDVWNEYQEAAKHDVYQQKKVVIDANALHFMPAEFRPILPDWRWILTTELTQDSNVLIEGDVKQVKQFCRDIINIIFIYDQMRDLGTGSDDAKRLPKLRTQWKELVTNVLEQGNPFKKT